MSTDQIKVSRRELLVRSAAGAAAFTAAACRISPLLAAPASRWFKIGVCGWSTGKQYDPAVFDLAKTIGLDGVQLDVRSTTNKHLTQPQVQETYQAAAKRAGVEISSLALTILNGVPLKSDPRALLWVNESIDACKALGLTVILVPFFGPGDIDMQRTAEIDHLVKALQQAAPKAEKQGVVLGLESYLTAEDNIRLLDRVGSPAVKVYYDVGNSTDKGHNVYKEIRLLGPRICEFHAKDGGYMLGQGRIDFKAVRRAIDDIQYSGWLQIEAATPHGLIPDYTADRKFLKSIFPAHV